MAALVVLYAAAGYWLAPRLLLDALQERAAALGATLKVDEVRTDPFALTVDLSGIELQRPDGRRLAEARGIAVDLAWASLWSDAWIVQHASVHSPHAEFQVGPKGHLNWPVPANGSTIEKRTAALQVQSLSVSDGSLHVLDRSRGAAAELTLQRIELQVHNLATHGGEAQYQLAARLAAGGTLASQGTFSLAPVAGHGKLELANVSLAEAWRLAAPGVEGARGGLGARARYAYEKGRIELHDLQADATGVDYAGLEILEIALQVPQLAIPPAQAVPMSAQVRLVQGGSVAASGTLEAQPFAADFDVEASGIPLALAQRFLPESLAVNVESGRVSAKGTVEVGGGGAAFDGAAEVQDLRLAERGSGRVLLAWKLARSEALALRLPGGVDIGELVVRAPQGRLSIEEDGRVNLADVFGRGARDGGKPFHANVRRVRLENGTLHFADRSLETPFEVTIAELSGTVTGFSTMPGDPALVALTGRVGEYGSVKIRGTIDLDEPKSLANITAQFRNVGLAQLTPYIVKFAGYRVRSGRLSADLRYQVRDGGLVGQNQLVFRELELGEKVERAGAKDLPLELAVALLSDAQGRITLDIPVRGNLNDPQFDFGGLVARALGNAIGKIVSAPFRALAGLLGREGGQDLGEARFEPGSAALSPPQEESVAEVAKALAERPQLGVVVRGGYDPERDAAALRREAARREIARRAGYRSAGPLDFSDRKILHAAENLYLERVGNRLDLQALREREARYGRALTEALAATVPPEARGAEALARERGQAVRAALVEHGVEPARIALEDPSAQKAGEEGVPTQLALTADVPVQEMDLVREAQRKLDAAGFDPGPVDGQLGPLTERALRRFQQAQELRASGVLDASTLAALGLQADASTGGTRR